jgi:hypothetical protein
LRSRIVLSATAVAICAAVIGLPSTPASAAVASELRRYPYLTDLVTSNVTINWATTTSLSTGSATYGRVGSESCTAHSVTATRTSITVGSTAEYQWKAQVSGLAPDAAYCYRVFGGTSDLLGSDPSPQFKSQVPAGSNAPFSFAVFGDWGLSGTDGTNPDQARLMSQIAASGARFALTTGDNGYNSGTQTEYGDMVQTGPGLSGIFGPGFWTVPGRSIPLFPTQGNHGMNSVPLINWPQDRAVATSGGRYQMDTYCCVNNTNSASYPSDWYAFDAGPARFYVLEASWANSNVGSSNLYGNDAAAHWSVSSPEYQWLAADLAAHPGGMKFAFFHFPLYSANGSEVSDTFLQGASPKLEGLLGDNGVKIVFNGHAHIYTRSTASAAGRPVTYVTGGGGATLESVSKCGAPVAAAIGWSPSSNHGSACGSLAAPATADRVYHFLLVSVNGSQVTVTPTDELGRTFDVQTYTFSGGGGGGDTQNPTPPTNLQATGSTGKVDLTWTAGTDDTGVTGYKVFRDGSQIDTIGAVTSYTDTNVTAGATYSYTLQSLDAAGHTSVQSDPATATVPSGSGGSTLTFTPTDDATIIQGSASTNYGSQATLQTDGSPIKDFLMKFNVSGIGASAVSSASLRMFVADSAPAGGVVRPTTGSSWSEGSVTWSNAPASASSPTATIPKVSSGTWINVDVTPFVSSDGVLSLRVSSTNSDGADYVSKEGTAANRPQLIVTTGTGGGGGGGGGGGQLTFGPTDDATIIQGSATTNFGSQATLQTDGSPVKDFLMKFNVSGVGTSTVSSATLRLFVADSSPVGGDVRPTVGSAWSQGSVTWSTAPAAASSPTATIGKVSSGTWITVDVTSFVIGDGVVSLRISSTNNNGADYVSSEGAAANAPQLIVSTS